MLACIICLKSHQAFDAASFVLVPIAATTDTPKVLRVVLARITYLSLIAKAYFPSLGGEKLNTDVGCR